MVECGRHSNMELMTLSEVTEIEGSAGRFSITVEESPRYVDPDKCIACGICTDSCPVSVDSEHDAGTGERKAIHIKYAQAVPLKFQIDAASCIGIKKPGSCGLCRQACDAGAINFGDTGETHHIEVGAVILAPGYEVYDPTGAGVWGAGVFPNVVTSLQFERLLASSGPTRGAVSRPSDGRPVHRVAWLQCVGSRDKNLCDNSYCSSVCCMYAIKEAVVAKEHLPGLQASIFYLDMRTHGKEFDLYMERARNESGVRFVRCRVHGVESDSADGDLRLRYVNEEGRQIEEIYDMVVLSVGLETPQHVLDLARVADIKLNADNFAATSDFAPVETSRAGIYACGVISGPKDIPQAVTEGAAAAAVVADLLSSSRFQASREPVFPEEADCCKEQVRTGVFVCHCGSNIAGNVDVDRVADYAATLPGVVFVEQNVFSCSQDSQDLLTQCIRKHRLNRIVVAACSPRTHEPLFRETLKRAGLNEHLVEMANIRNHNSWVHGDRDRATTKAGDLIRMAVAKVSLAESLQPVTVPVTQKGLVIGGGVAGMSAALNLAEQGFEVHLVEKTGVLGGNALNLKHTWSGEHIPAQVTKLIDKVIWHDRIIIHKESRVTAVEGFVGNFITTLGTVDGGRKRIEHGTAIIATGGEAYIPDEYSYGSITGVVTAVQFDKLYELNERHVKNASRFVFIQCVGSREEGSMYCSKVCCTHSVQSAIALKKENPDRKVYILYREIRTYAQRESLYNQARKLGIIFINYELHGKPEVTVHGKAIRVEVWDHVLHKPLRIETDLVILATAIRPAADGSELGRLFKVPLGTDGFFQEAHAKLRPVDFAVEGIFVAGLAHYPKPVDESIVQALAASAKSATLLSKPRIQLDAVKAIVDEEKCDGCALCIDVCPFHAITLVEKTGDAEGADRKIVVVNLAYCKGCGLCQGTCPKRGISVSGFTMQQIGAQVTAALAG
jgi:heterodisulfide reductase subunit A